MEKDFDMAAIHDLIDKIEDEALRERISKEVEKLSKQKKFGLVFEEHLPECTPLYDIPVKRGSKVALRARKVSEFLTVLKIEDGKALCLNKEKTETNEYDLDELVCVAEFGEPIYPYLKPIDSVCNAPDSDLWHTLIEADNYHALQLLEYLYAGKVDCIYIDPPYNTGARDWKYNNDYVDSSDSYRHSKWLSFMEKRLRIAKKLLNPKDSVLIVTIDEKEYLHLGCLLEEMFPEANIQMITDIINPRGTNRGSEFSRVEEYVFICRFGASVISKTENNMLGNTDETGKARVWYGFNRGNNARSTATGQFFPIYINEKNQKIIKVGEALGANEKQSEAPQIEGLTAVFPINSHGNESIWGAVPETTREWVEKGYVRVSGFDKKNKRWTLSYIRSGLQKRIESGEIVVNGRAKDGSLDIQHIDAEKEVVPPKSVWYQSSHKSYDFGSTMIKNIIPNHSFSFPKSLYSTHDAIRFFVENKKDALIIDFFAGSGTTLHAVNLLNKEDGGKRRCIIVTNNEVSVDEAKGLKSRGYKPGDAEWEKLGVARFITWPRTVCSIKGIDINGRPLQGNYLGTNAPMAEGFKANAAFFKLGFLDKTKVSLGMQFKEMLPTLWMKAGAHGRCPQINDVIPDILMLRENRMAVLNDENCFAEFSEKLQDYPEIKTVYLVTDYENSYISMAQGLQGRQTYQLYRDYLDNFRINAGRNGR